MRDTEWSCKWTITVNIKTEFVKTELTNKIKIKN